MVWYRSRGGDNRPYSIHVPNNDYNNYDHYSDNGYRDPHFALVFSGTTLRIGSLRIGC